MFTSIDQNSHSMSLFQCSFYFTNKKQSLGVMSEVRISELFLEPGPEHKFSESSLAGFFCIPPTQLTAAKCHPK